MDRLTKPKAFLEKLTLTDADYQDNGMINHIADLLERYHAEQLRLGGVSNSVCSCRPNTDLYCETITKCNKCQKEVKIVRTN